MANCLKTDGETYGHASECAWIIPSVVPHLKCESIYYARKKKKKKKSTTFDEARNASGKTVTFY